MAARTDIVSDITSALIDSIARDGLAPWSRPWTGAAGGFPRNAKSGKAYRGINVISLWLQSQCAGYGSSYWLTFKQAKELGGSVRKGEKGTKIIFWKMLDSKDKETGEDVRIPMARAYTVFNAEQCDGLPAKFTSKPEPVSKPDEENAEAERIIDAWPVWTTREENQAYYSPSTDRINMPARENFVSHAAHYTTHFHEMGHSTGHASRLDRKELQELRDVHAYSREELVAEFTACFLAAHCGFERTVLNNSAAYLKHWVSKLQEQPKMLVQAAQAAQKAFDLILESADATAYAAE